MTLNLTDRSFIVFDLDDTLFKEIEYVRSAYTEISQILLPETRVDTLNEMMELRKLGRLPFREIIAKYKIKKYSETELIQRYKTHKPKIELTQGVDLFLSVLIQNGIKLGLITDGRSETQRNKLKSLSISGLFDLIIISEELGTKKPCVENFKIFPDNFPTYDFTYVADNVMKDFVTPKKLGWRTICIRDDGRNIHKQDFNMDPLYLPHYVIDSFEEIEIRKGN